MKAHRIYIRQGCPFCVYAIKMLEDKNADFEIIDVTFKPEIRQQVSAENGNYPTVPMVFVANQFVGGFSELSEMDNEGRLDKLLQS